MLIPRQIGITLRTSLLTFSRSVERLHHNVTSSLYWLKVQLGFKHVWLDTINRDISIANTSVSVPAWLYMLEESRPHSLTANEFISSPQTDICRGSWLCCRGRGLEKTEETIFILVLGQKPSRWRCLFRPVSCCTHPQPQKWGRKLQRRIVGVWKCCFTTTSLVVATHGCCTLWWSGIMLHAQLHTAALLSNSVMQCDRSARVALRGFEVL